MAKELTLEISKCCKAPIWEPDICARCGKQCEPHEPYPFQYFTPMSEMLTSQCFCSKCEGEDD